MKPFNVDVEKVKNSASYKMSAFMMKMPIWVLFIISTAFSMWSGYVTTQSSILMKGFVSGETALSKLFVTYATICACGVLSQACINMTTKSMSLKIINKDFVDLYQHVFDSKTADISKIGPAKVHSSVNALACLKANRARIYMRMIQCGIPFIVTIWNVATQNLYAALGMMALMTVALLCSINGDKWFHFDTIKASMKGDMQSISINNFIVVRMLKYMNARKYSVDRLNHAQDEASPAMHGTWRIMYTGGFVNALYQLPILIALGVAIKSGNTGLIVFIAMNDWAITNTIDLADMLAENLSEKHGEEAVIENLKGDDIPNDEKPVMPESMTLRDVEFYYPSDKGHRNAFCIPEFHIEKGKRYRFASPSGGGKSTMFRYFAGEMEANKPFDVRTFYIHQRTELVTGTVRENITLGNPWVPDAIIEELIRDVRLDQWYDALPNGLDTKIGDAGLEPSGGEASRISLLRLFIHIRGYNKDGANRNTNDIIILDEVTSALDKRDIFIGDDELSTEEAVIKVIDRECAGCTMFVISHEDANSSAFGFKDIVDEQLQVVTSSHNGKFYHTLMSADAVDEHVCVHHKIAI